MEERATYLTVFTQHRQQKHGQILLHLHERIAKEQINRENLLFDTSQGALMKKYESENCFWAGLALGEGVNAILATNRTNILCTYLYSHIYPLYCPAGKQVGIERKINIVVICSITFLLASMSRVVSNCHQNAFMNSSLCWCASDGDW